MGTQCYSGQGERPSSFLPKSPQIAQVEPPVPGCRSRGLVWPQCPLCLGMFGSEIFTGQEGTLSWGREHGLSFAALPTTHTEKRGSSFWMERLAGTRMARAGPALHCLASALVPNTPLRHEAMSFKGKSLCKEHSSLASPNASVPEMPHSPE